MPTPDLTGKVVVLTGGNTGIGKQTAIALAKLGATVAITARNEAKGRAARDDIARASGNDGVQLLSLDLASLASIRACAADVLARFDRLDVLVNNAGAIISTRQTTEEGFELTFGANHLGPFLLTDLLLDRLQESAPSRIVNLASIGHRMAVSGLPWNDLQHQHGRYNGTAAYTESKLANVLFTVELARRLAGSGVTVNCCHPGAVRSEFAGADDTRGFERVGMALVRPFLITPAQGAKVVTYLASSPDIDGLTGGYFVGGYQSLLTAPAQHTPSKFARDPGNGRRLWEISEELVASARRADAP